MQQLKQPSLIIRFCEPARIMATEKKKRQIGPKTQSGNQRTSTKLLPPHRIYYSFADALKIVQSKVPNCTTDYLLYCGLMRRVKFFVHIPYQFDIDIIDVRRLERYKNQFAPRLLILNYLDCGEIEWSKKKNQRTFLCGYRLNGFFFQEFYPMLDQLGPKPELAWCIFEKEKKENNEKIPGNDAGFFAQTNDAPDQFSPPTPEVFNVTPSVKTNEFTISEKNLFVMHEELSRLISHEISSSEYTDLSAQVIADNAHHDESLYQKTLKSGQTVRRQFQIQERSQFYLSPNIYFTLEEAIEALKPRRPECTSSKLLEFGCTNKLTFITPVPIGVDLAVSDTPILSAFDKPLYLIVESADCEIIMREGIVNISRFKRGHGFSHENSFEIYPPGNRHDRSSINPLQWDILYQGQPHEIAISVDRLFLVQSDLANLVLNEPGPWIIDCDKLKDVHESLLDQPVDKARLTDEGLPSVQEKSIAAPSEQCPSILSEREVIIRLGRSRTTINAYQNENHKSYDRDFPKKRKVAGSSRRIVYLESEVTRWGNAHPLPK